MKSGTRGLARDAGSIVIGWLTKLVAVLAIIGVMAFDALSIGAAHVSATDDADSAASAAQTAWAAKHDVQTAYNAAAASLTNPSEQVLTRGFAVDPDGTVHLLLRRTVSTTLVLRHLGPLKKYTVFTVVGEATPPTT